MRRATARTGERRSAAPLWSELVLDRRHPTTEQAGPHLLGVLPGEGIGPEVTGAALAVLDALENRSEARFETRLGMNIEFRAEVGEVAPLSEAVVDFCSTLFLDGGSLLAGPGRGRFVYDLRRRFDLFCKLNPLRPAEELHAVCRLKPECVRDADVLVVRENTGGVYQGEWSAGASETGRYATHSFTYTEPQVRRTLGAAARLAQARSGHLAVVVKAGGAPSVSALWRDLAPELTAQAGVTYECLDVDFAAYLMVQDPLRLDVVVAPNLFGDVLSDLGSVLLASRGLSFAGSFAPDGAAVYQTNHGAALDITGRDRANPVGQLFALAMLLRESFGLRREAARIERAVRMVWRDGWRTADLAEPGCRTIGTRQMGALVAERIAGSDEEPGGDA